ncbi:MAG: hypothetical protein B6D59_07775 [Campylobacteraceae bacterium 4484_4]|nr:MAG: hypothetical protein B6D59_07775 [Campylobacteraceae bacterium 4484_4]
MSEKYVVELESEADYVDFMRAKFENEIKKIEKEEERLKNKIAGLRRKKEQVEEELSAFKKQFPAYFRRGRKPKSKA